MKDEVNSDCPNCSELWKRIDRLEQEKIKNQKKNINWIVCFTIMATLGAVSIFVKLINS